LWSVYWAFKLIAKKEGMGYGDFKLLAAIGAWTGWQVLPFVIVASAGVGAVVGGAVLILSKRGSDTRIPFGPYLALGGILGLVWGREAVTAWLGTFPG
jgi:leader peptidase (prepilin peptidase)/N-methyltransferase